MSDDPEFEQYARRVIDELVPKIQESVLTISLVPDEPDDIKFAIELGLSIMLDKPILLAVPPGREIPEHLVRVADAIVDLSGDDVTERLSEAIEGIVPKRRE